MQNPKKKYESYYVMLEVATRFLEDEKIDTAFEKTGFDLLEAHQKSHIHFVMTHFLRYKNVCDKIIKIYMSKAPQKKYRIWAEALLGLGIIELFFSQKEDKMILSHYTDIAKNDKKTSHLSGMVRAILGNIWRDKETLQAEFSNYKNVFTIDFIKAIQKDYPNDVEAILNALLEKHRLCATILSDDLNSDSEIFKDCTKITHNHILPVDGTPIASWNAIKDGDVIIQSVASSLPVLSLGNLQDKVFYDLCAAPGGKAMQASAKGAKVTAIDVSNNRMERLKENFARTGLKADLKTISALEFKPNEQADIVLLDAPCSATGTIRKNPDLISSYSSKDVNSLIKLQKELLAHAKTLVKKEGILIYATCSLHKSESEDQVKSFLQENPAFSLFIPDFYKDYPFMIEGDIIRILPHHKIDDIFMDGFFVAYLKNGSAQ